MKGKVQHVGFRFWTECLAIKLNIKGFVRNSKEECFVELEIEGYADRVETFLNLIENGHPHARVESVEKESIDVKGYLNFTILR